MKEIGMDTIRKLAKFTQKIKTTYLVGIMPSQLIEKLVKLEVDIVVDVRKTVRTPMIYMPKYFQDILSLGDIDYIRYPALGNPSKLRKRARNNYILAKELYFEYIKDDKKAQEQFYDLFKELRFKKNQCLTCVCNTLNPKLCHRFWLKEALINEKRSELGFKENYVLDLNPLLQEVN